MQQISLRPLFVAFLIAVSCCVLARADELVAAVAEFIPPVADPADVAVMGLEAALASAVPTGKSPHVVKTYHCDARPKHLSAACCSNT
jgi:hypothetical protein